KKRPHVYSKEYQGWHHCTKNRDEAGARSYAAAWVKHYGLKRGRGHGASLRRNADAVPRPVSSNELREAALRQPQIRVRGRAKPRPEPARGSVVAAGPRSARIRP